MAETPGRTPFDSSADDGASGDPTWGSPVPAEYGSLRAVGPPDGPSGRRRTGGLRARDGEPRLSTASMLRRIQGAGTGTGVGSAQGTDVEEPPLDDLGLDGNGEGRSNGAGFIGKRRVTRAPIITEDLMSPLPIRQSSWRDLGWFGWGDGSPKLSRKERKANRRATTVRTKATIRHLDLLTVLRVSLIFYLIVLIMVVFASILLWYAADAFGTLPSMEKSIRTLFDLKTFKIHPTVVAKYTSLGGAVLAVAGVFANVLGALMYNLISDLVGGVRVEMDSYPTD